ncbi:hypothetical protein J2S00_001367 [Caldalkalibacillus uzonensis]|uniref:Uncharacterized protein n=1 Tax=Caldalkalibacillus uzonensis TaxID=353224 RepID=A0ABU0CRT9_9BACI|nr:hypothetical protein [Caldalkalibacillus uzonensis]
MEHTMKTIITGRSALICCAVFSTNTAKELE